MRAEHLGPARMPKTTTLCPMWFFGGPHLWLDDDTCHGCGKTRNQVKADRQRGFQPKLGCEDYGHVVERSAPLHRRPPLALVIDNTRRTAR